MGDIFSHVSRFSLWGKHSISLEFNDILKATEAQLSITMWEVMLNISNGIILPNNVFSLLKLRAGKQWVYESVGWS